MESFRSVDKVPLACRFQKTVGNRFTKLCAVRYLVGFYSKLPDLSVQERAQSDVLLSKRFAVVLA